MNDYEDYKWLNVFHSLGIAHANTSQEHPPNELFIQNFYMKVNEQYKRSKEQLHLFRMKAERCIYMSPVEYAFILAFPRFETRMEMADQSLNQWYEKTKQHHRYRTVQRCYIHSEGVTSSPFMLNKRVEQQTPLEDLLLLFGPTWSTFSHYEDHRRKEWFEAYEKSFQLYPEEYDLLAAFLLFPRQIEQVILRYQMNKESEFQSTKAFTLALNKHDRQAQWIEQIINEK